MRVPLLLLPSSLSSSSPIGESGPRPSGPDGLSASETDPADPPGFSPSPSAPPPTPSRRSGLSPPGASTHVSDRASEKHQSTIPKPAQNSFCCLVEVWNHFTSFTFAFSSVFSGEDSLLDLAPALV